MVNAKTPSPNKLSIDTGDIKQKARAEQLNIIGDGRGIRQPTKKRKNNDILAEIASSFLRLAALKTCPLDRLSRYEYLLGGKLVKSYSTWKLRGATGKRRGDTFSIPILRAAATYPDSSDNERCGNVVVLFLLF